MSIVNTVFNMENDLAVFVTYAAHLVDGNLITNKLSIGRKSAKTGPDPPSPAIVGGLNTHGVFEGGYYREDYVIQKTYKISGDSSMTRGDAFFGDNHSLNETLFQQVCHSIT